MSKKTEANVAHIHRWIAKRSISEIKATVLQTNSGKWACMISFVETLSGAANILHMGFTPHKAVADRIALANVIGFASR